MCPECDLEVPFKDKVCIHCGYEFPKPEVKPPPPPVKEEPRQKPGDNITPGPETHAKAPKG